MASKQEGPEWLHVDEEAGVENQHFPDNLKKPQQPGTDGDDPFGNEEVGEVQYRTMSWW